MSEVKSTGKHGKVAIKELRIQFIPVLTPSELWFWDMKVENSPHVELFEMYRKHGFHPGRMMGTRYVHERQRRLRIGYTRWTDDYILNIHLPKRFKVFDSIRKHGYDKTQPILVLREPLWSTRFGYGRDWLKGPEISTGAGRAAACCVLGIDLIPVEWVKDKRPGSNDKGKFEEKLAGIADNGRTVWDETFGKPTGEAAAEGMGAIGV
jgi:hypothetical protein